ncbi:MAG TPA: metal ABC transporter substrate-binding protein [Bacteroidota bacterium]
MKFFTWMIAAAILSGYAPAQNKQKVVTTLNYLRYLAGEVGGDYVEAVALANPRQDPHFVTPTPTMNEITNEAELFIENGLSLDLWAKNVVDASGNPRIQGGTPGHLVGTVNVPIRELPTEISRTWGDIHPQGNPHCWLDPLNAKIIAANIAAGLSRLDPAHAEYYKTRAEQFSLRIDRKLFGDRVLNTIGAKAGDILTRKLKSGSLYEWLESKGLALESGAWMERARLLQGVKIVSYHKTYVYFAARFGLDIIGELEEKPGIPPPPQHRDAIVEQVKARQVKVIMNDNFYSREAADYVAEKTGAVVIVTFIDVGGSDQTKTYEDLITYLLDSVLQQVKKGS